VGGQVISRHKPTDILRRVSSSVTRPLESKLSKRNKS
jgi:hypothetical protein